MLTIYRIYYTRITVVDSLLVRDDQVIAWDLLNINKLDGSLKRLRICEELVYPTTQVLYNFVQGKVLYCTAFFCQSIHARTSTFNVNMVAIRANEKQNPCIAQRRIPKWLIIVVVCFAMTILNTLRRQTQLSSVKAKGTISNKLEAIFPKPDGTKDYNLVKENTTSFNAFSFYLMGDTPVSYEHSCINNK